MRLFQCMNVLAIILLAPIQVLAHEEEHVQAGTGAGFLQYSFYITLGLLTGSIILWFITRKKLNQLSEKTKAERQQKENLMKLKKAYQWISIVLLFISSIALVSFLGGKEKETGEIAFHHIHGLGYTPEGDIYVPAHDGLRVYHDNHWAIPEGPMHDYMGFSMTNFGFYSSGHPEPGSKMKNPFGIVKSTDMGQTVETLDLYGEVDFHGMAVGYNNHAIYVFNPEKNSRMDEAGLFYTLDETKTWDKSNLGGIQGQPAALAVHPDKENVIAIGTNQGLFLSDDYGQTFTPILSNSPITAIHFDFNNTIIVGTVSENMQAGLSQINLETEEVKELQTPAFQEEDAISYMAVNPVNEHELVIATYKKDIFLTRDHGGNWTKIAESGIGASNNIITKEATNEHVSEHSNHSHDHGNHSGKELQLQALWHFKEEPKENEEQVLQIQIADEEGKKIKNFELEHEKLMHLIVVSKDLAEFQHLHPEFKENGLFDVPIAFPKGGEYTLFADVVPTGYAPSTISQTIKVMGNEQEKELTADESLTKEVDGKTITLSFDKLQLNEKVILTFELEDTKTGNPITNLQPYLGANGHVVIISEDHETYLHSHPMKGDSTGPQAAFSTTFMKPGLYKIWGQFKHNDQIITVPFVVEIRAKS